MTLLQELLQRLPLLQSCEQDICDAGAMLLSCFQKEGKVLLCGNGGSAADAEHWSGELLKGFVSKRPLPEDSGLSETLRQKLQGGLPAIPLTGFHSLHTAFSNDVDPDYVYAQLVWALGKPGDVLVAISTSGNARNVCAAAEAARGKGMQILGLTGQSGGQLKALCDCCISVPEQNTHLVQELHLPVYHTLCLMVEEKVFD